MKKGLSSGKENCFFTRSGEEAILYRPNIKMQAHASYIFYKGCEEKLDNLYLKTI